MKFTRSIRWRMQLWLAFLLATILSGFGVTAYQLHRMNRFNQIDDELSRRLGALSSDVRARLPGPPPGGHGPFEHEGGHKGGQRGIPPLWPDGPEFDRDHPPFEGKGPGRWGGPGPLPARGEFRIEPPPVNVSLRTLSLFNDTETNGFYYAVWSRQGTLLAHSSNSPAALALPPRMGSDTTPHTRMLAYAREAYHFTEIGECVLAGRAVGAELAALRRFGWVLFGAGAGVLAVGLGGGWLLIAGAIRPIQSISAAAGRISAGNLAERIDFAETESELGRLAAVLNSTFARLDASFAQQKQFTADASHELRTPITVILSETQTTLAHERNAADYRESLKVCGDAAQQMRTLTDSLLQLARFDAGQEPFQRAAFDLAEQVRACLDLVEPLAKTRGLSIHSDLMPASALGDADRIRQVITNLLVNAISYNRDQGQIRISTRSEKGLAILTVEDTGQGIAPEDLPHIFERFYRADKSRARSEGHHGLGLAICKSIIDAHGGEIRVSSELGVGTTFVLQIPG